MTSTHATPQVAATTTVASPRTVPNLIVIGAMKASTTTFYELIGRHPQVWFPSEKEPHYFTSPDFGQTAAWENYLRLFQSAPAAARVLGEASTGYSKLPHFGNTPQRLRDVLGEPKLIYLVRDPVERTISNYHHAQLAGHYPPGTTCADALENDRILIDASLYARQIRDYHAVFDPAQLLVIPVNQLHAEPAAVMRRVEAFLDLAAYDGWDSTLPQSNSNQSLGGSLAVQAMLPKSVLATMKKLLPPAVRQRLKGLAQKPVTAAPVTDADRQTVFASIADDLGDLLSLVDADVSPWLDAWPSVQQLRASRPREVT